MSCTAIDSPTDTKRLATLKAQCALAGVELHESQDDQGTPLYVVTKRAMTRHLVSLDDVAAWLERFAGVKA